MSDTEKALLVLLCRMARGITLLEKNPPPKVGDLVVEVTHWHRDPEAIGWLVSIRGPAHSPTEIVIARLTDGHPVLWRNGSVRACSDTMTHLAGELFPASLAAARSIT